MHKSFIGFLAAAAMFAATGTMHAAENKATETLPAPRPGIIRVKLQPEAARLVGSAPRLKAHGKVDVGTAPLSKAASAVKAVKISPMLPPNPKFAAQRAKYGLDRWYVVEFDESINADAARKIFAGTSGVEKSEAIIPMSLQEGNGAFVNTTRPPMKATAADYMFNDPQLPSQWHYYNDGSLPGSVAGADINLLPAWKETTGSPNVLVAIIDGGVDYRHEDLAQNMFVNEAELNGTPGVDDDGNGYVDDIYGYNFCSNSGEIYPHSHGTHVAGTVAAVNNNGIGVAGVAGGNGSKDSGVRMISCQIFDPRSGLPEADYAKAIVYAAEMGATIAQCSWGWEAAGYYEQAVLDAIDYFTETARSEVMTGGLCIFATGNYGITGDCYPACYDKVLAVASMSNDLRPTSYSNYGDWVDIIAPGGLLDFGEANGVLSTLPNNSYGFNEGTSMATPHVSGIAALVLSKYGSPTYVNESLRSQLLTAVNDFYGQPGNSGFAGLYGAGYIDAAKALVFDDGSAPAVVADFELTAAQDNIEVSWTLASDAPVPDHHIIYYSETPFTAANLGSVKNIVADTRFAGADDKVSADINDLKALTAYYVALVAVNRWGKASELSPVKSVTTNEGPHMTLGSTRVSMSSTADNKVASASFEIGNDADGILRWSAAKRTVRAVPQSMSRPFIGRTTAYSGKLDGKKVRAPRNMVPADYDAADYPVNITYGTELRAYIGDTDAKVPNSMAQWFYIDPDKYADGFNLTAINVAGAYGENPTIEIYKGDAAISSATLLKKVNYSFFAFNYPITLDEQLYFAPGESFWVAVHFDGGQDGYPLALYTAADESTGGYSYMSNDKGRTWTQLSDALKGSPYESLGRRATWGITARSLNPDWSSVMELTPESGVVRKGETQTVTASADGSKIVNGTYSFKVLFETNETGGSDKSVTVAYTVAGNKPEIRAPKIVDFGSLLVGQSKTVSVELYNSGYGSFRGSEWGSGLYSDQISVTNDNFAGPEYVSSGFPARTSTTVELTFAPKTAGSHTGYVTFTGADGAEARVLVQGAATEPAKLALEPAVIDAGTLTVGAGPSKATFRIANNGKYPLEYVFPRFSDEQIEGRTAANHKFGYTVASTLEGFNAFGYDGNPALINPTDIVSQFSDDVAVSRPVSLGFSFPYYGKSYDKVYINSFGGVQFALSDDAMHEPVDAGDYGVPGTGLICAYGRQLRFGPDSKVEYAKADGKFVVRFTDVLAVVYDTDYTPVSFRITLSGNGDIEIFYDNIDSSGLFQEGSTLYLGINDPDCTDVITLTSAGMADYWGTEEPTPDNSRFRSIVSGTAVRFEAPKASFVTALSVPYGIVTPGESVEVTATLAAGADLNAGPTFNQLTILTNDPAPDYSFVRINAVIAGESLVPVAEFENSDIDCGDVFRTAVVKVPVTLKNTGHDAMQVTAAGFDNSLMSTTVELPFTLEAGMAKDIVVTVPTVKEGAVADVLTVATSAGDVKAAIKANVIGCPAADISIAEITETIPAKEPLARTFTVSNSGNETLRYSVKGDEMVSLTLPEKENATTSYSYASSLDNTGVKFAWQDIETTGLGTHNNLSYYMMHDYVAVELPFDFPFYGKKFNKMYVYNTGFVSFTERHDDKLWPEPPAEFPAGSVYTNIIAPYWGLHSMDETRNAGTYHYVTDDRAIVSFMEYGNSMNYGVCFQLILEKDGSFTFQYKGKNEEAIIFDLFGLAGITDLSGENYIKLPSRLVQFNQAVRFSPVVEMPLEPGKSDEIALGFNTDRMAGNYTGVVTLNTNVPAREKIEIPYDITLTGEARPVWPADAAVEHPLGYTDYNDPIVQMMGSGFSVRVDVANEGTAPFTILGATADGPVFEDPEFGYELPGFGLFAEVDGFDWITGEPDGSKMWNFYEGTPVTVGADVARFAVVPTAYEVLMTPGTYEVPVTFMYTTGSPYDDEAEILTRTVNVTVTITPLPAMTLSNYEGIYVKAADESAIVRETLTIGNEGEYKLDYTLRLDPTGAGESDDTGGGIAPMARASRTKAAPEVLAALAAGIAPMDRSTNVYDAPQDFDYTNAVFYPAMENTTGYNYGSATLYDSFKAATVFTAPAGGFNMSHLYLPVTLYTQSAATMASDYTVTIDVLLGSDPAGNNIAGRGSLHIAEQTTGSGRFYVVPLERAVYFNEGEEFTVRVNFEPGVGSPAYLMPKQDSFVPGRYMAWVESAGWYDAADLFKDQYGSLGWLMTPLETVPGQPWVRLVDTPEAGSVAVGESTDVKIEINPAAARLEKGNQAVLVIRSNDMNMPLINFPIVLDLNGAPVIGAPENIVYAKEGETTAVEVTVAEPDLDDFEISFQDGAAMAKVVAVEASEYDSATVTANDAEDTWTVSGATEPVTVKVEIAPDFGQASAGNAFTVSAADKAGKSASATVRYTVEHVNRAPVAVEHADIDVPLGGTSPVVSFAEFFSDPDGDELTYTFGGVAGDIAEAYTTGTGVIFFGKATGNTTATVTATDASGLSAVAAIPVKVLDVTGIDNVEASAGKLTVMPNPVEDILHAVCGFDADNAVFTLFDASGKAVATECADAVAGRSVDINVSSLPAGHYILVVATGESALTARVIKR